MTVKDLWYHSCGAGMIHYRRWEPEGEPVAVLQIVHGIVDHGGRYEDFAGFMTEHGFLVIAEDHMGHGRSGGMGTVRGYFNGGWFCAVEDTYTLLAETRKAFPDIPYFFLGHSMGSYMALTILERHPDCGINGCILCGSGWQPEAALSAGIRLSKAACRISGEEQPSKRLFEFVVGAFNLRVESPVTEYDWTNRDDVAVSEFLADPLCGFAVKAGLMRDLLTGIAWAQDPQNLGLVDKSLPVVLISGDEDPVGLYGEGVKRTYDQLVKTGLRSVSMRLYAGCRHELLHELNKQDVYCDVLKWCRDIIG